MNRKKGLLPLTLGMLALLSACGPQAPAAAESVPAEERPTQAQEAYHKITAEEAKEMMDGGDVTVVDVRRSDEYQAGHIPGAVLVPNEDIGETQPEALPDTDAKLIVYCRTGVRSKQAADKLVDMGYTAVYDMGGIVDWTYDTVTGGEPG